ncbi:HAMP domain-containing protein [Patescibacteria group bacterium]|nr:HAMP domain-containing protein [Patescibacteria group bacterium]MBU4481756.1 HAMP domain-containing protein [Patescibacteria group bacterium]
MLKGIFGKIFVLVVGISLIVSMFILVVTIGERTKSTEEALVQENKLLAKIVSKNIEAGYYADILPLETLKIISDSENILFVWVVKPSGVIYLADDPQMLGKIIDDPSLGTERVEVRDSVYLKDGKKIKLIIQPIGIKEEGKLWSFFLGVSLEEIAAAKKRIIFSSLGFFIAVLIFTALISFYLTKGVTKPLEYLREGAEIIGEGNFGYRIEIKTGDEIEELAEAFNQMAKGLSQSRAALEESKTVLEIKIKARTLELEELAKGLDEKVKERTKELRERIAEMEKFQRLTVGRELKMVALKKEIKGLETELAKYGKNI